MHFRVYLEVYVYENPTSFSRWSVRYDGMHDIQQNTAWSSNPYENLYATVPDTMVEDIIKTKGYCDIKLNADGTEVESFIAREIPKIELTEEISDTELIQAEMLLNQESIIAKQKEHDEILAELLLGQQKGV